MSRQFHAKPQIDSPFQIKIDSRQLAAQQDMHTTTTNTCRYLHPDFKSRIWQFKLRRFQVSAVGKSAEAEQLGIHVDGGACQFDRCYPVTSAHVCEAIAGKSTCKQNSCETRRPNQRAESTGTLGTATKLAPNRHRMQHSSIELCHHCSHDQ